MELLTALTVATFALAGVLGHLLSARADDRARSMAPSRGDDEDGAIVRRAGIVGRQQGRILGAAALEALLDSELLQPEDADMVALLASHAGADAAGYTGVDRPVTEGAETHG